METTNFHNYIYGEHRLFELQKGTQETGMPTTATTTSSSSPVTLVQKTILHFKVRTPKMNLGPDSRKNMDKKLLPHSKSATSESRQQQVL